MKILNLIFNGLDYMFYRVAKTYYKWDRKSKITAYFSISLFLSLLFIVTSIAIMGKPFLQKHINEIKIIAICLQLLMLLLVYIRYKDKFEILNEKYRMESNNIRTFKGILVVLALIFPFILMIIC